MLLGRDVTRYELLSLFSACSVWKVGCENNFIKQFATRNSVFIKVLFDLVCCKKIRGIVIEIVCNLHMFQSHPKNGNVASFFFFKQRLIKAG